MSSRPSLVHNRLTQRRLKKYVSYDPETGLFTWVVRRGRFKAGEIAGSFDGADWVRICIDKTTYPAAHLAWLYMTGDPPPGQIIYRNGNKRDHRWKNLECCADWRTYMIHRHARLAGPESAGSKLHFRGVYQKKNGQPGKWFYVFRRSGKYIRSGPYDSREDAVCAWINKLGEYVRESTIYPAGER